MAETLAQSDNLANVRYKSGQIHVYEVDESGKKTHISHDKALEDRGYDPADSAANYALRNQEQPTETPEQPSGNPEIDALRREMLELMRQMEANNERRHQEDPVEEQRKAIYGNGALKRRQLAYAVGGEKRLLPPQPDSS